MNLTNNKLEFTAFSKIYRYNLTSKVKYWFCGIMIMLVLFMLLPWTQNIKSKGIITTLKQEQRPQDINSPIPGKILKWWVKEGDYVKKGDTIMQLTEIKEEYLDPNLISRTQQQVQAKQSTLQNYESKISTADNQITALNSAKQLKQQQLQNKLSQLQNKLNGNRAELTAFTNDYTNAKDQFERNQKMFNEGLISLTVLQQRNVSFQNALAKKTKAENDVAQTLQELTITGIEQNSVEQEYTEKIAKAQGEQFQSMSQVAAGQGDIAKLQNQVTNYTIRNGMYYILAPQNGQIVQAKKAGIGEILKDGERITVIVPDHVDYAVEMFVRPIDLPLVAIGQKVRFTFDGFPAIVFSGWPTSSYGTFGGSIVAVENVINTNGLFRVLVAEDTGTRAWPKQLKIGSGAQGIALLKDVPIWYEMWRNINGFPPDFYDTKKTTPEKK